MTFEVLMLWWSSIHSINRRDWARDVARIPHAEVKEDLLTIHHVRNIDYPSETDFTVRYEDRTYDLSRIRGLDLFLSYWDSRAIAHPFLSWGFKGRDPLVISIETRTEETEQHSAIRGFFKQYELAYVVAEERDVVQLRTNYRGE